MPTNGPNSTTTVGGGGICPSRVLQFCSRSSRLSIGIISNRYFITPTTKGLVGTIDSRMDNGVETQPGGITCIFQDIEEWNMIPLGLFVKHSKLPPHLMGFKGFSKDCWEIESDCRKFLKKCWALNNPFNNMSNIPYTRSWQDHTNEPTML